MVLYAVGFHSFVTLISPVIKIKRPVSVLITFFLKFYSYLVLKNQQKKHTTLRKTKNTSKLLKASFTFVQSSIQMETGAK